MRNLALPILIALLAGCASTTQVRQAVDNSPATNGVAPRYAVGEIVISAEDVPAHFDDMIRNYLEADLRERHIGPDDAEPDRKVNINVTSYRMRGSVTRFMLGAFAGKDGVDSSVEVINVATGDAVGSSEVSSYNITAVGGQEDIAKMHAKEIGAFLAGERARKK